MKKTSFLTMLGLLFAAQNLDAKSFISNTCHNGLSSNGATIEVESWEHFTYDLRDRDDRDQEFKSAIEAARKDAKDDCNKQLKAANGKARIINADQFELICKVNDEIAGKLADDKDTDKVNHEAGCFFSRTDVSQKESRCEVTYCSSPDGYFTGLVLGQTKMDASVKCIAQGQIHNSEGLTCTGWETKEVIIDNKFSRSGLIGSDNKKSREDRNSREFLQE